MLFLQLVRCLQNLSRPDNIIPNSGYEPRIRNQCEQRQRNTQSISYRVVRGTSSPWVGIFQIVVVPYFRMELDLVDDTRAETYTRVRSLPTHLSWESELRLSQF